MAKKKKKKKKLTLMNALTKAIDKSKTLTFKSLGQFK
jgi:hypothetical protein